MRCPSHAQQAVAPDRDREGVRFVISQCSAAAHSLPLLVAAARCIMKRLARQENGEALGRLRFFDYGGAGVSS
jgi:hypothetical protein